MSKQSHFLVVFLVVIVSVKVHARKPNVLFVVIDDLRPALKCYGDENAYTPNIDGLAAKSFVFRNAFAQQALCAPSRNSFLTSRRPDSLHLYDFYSYWRQTVGNFTTLPQHFKENGYYTKSIGKVFHPGISSGFDDDAKYSWSTTPFHPKTQIYQNAKVCVDRDRSLASNLVCPVIVNAQPGGTLPDLESLNATLDFLRDWRNITNQEPFFLAVGFHKPHVPLKFPIDYLQFHPLDNVVLPKNRWRPSLLPTVAWNHWHDVRRRDDIDKLNISFPFGTMPDRMTAKIIQSYNAATTYIDDLLGKILAEVDTNTLIVLTGDHGWSRSEHGEFSKFSNFEMATRVPLLIHVPKLSTGEVIVQDLVELVDIFPTLVDLTQVSSPLKTCPRFNETILCTEGKSLVSAMVRTKNGQKSSTPGVVFTQYPRSGTYPTLHPNSDEPRLKHIKVMGYSINTGRFRYTEWVEFNHKTFKPNWRSTVGKELYDHNIDPDENMNLADRSEMEDIVISLRRQLILGWRYA